MQIVAIRLKNFQSFGPEPTELKLENLTFVLGPNGSGKTAVLEALSRMFSPVLAQRRIRLEDFHVTDDESSISNLVPEELWIEADIEFPEASSEEFHPSVPPSFMHMALDKPDGNPQVRIRLTAIREPDDYVEEKIEYITQVEVDGSPAKRSDMTRQDRALIEVHYLPARRDPADHVSYATTSMLGRMLRSADWAQEKQSLTDLSEEITTSMRGNKAVTGIGVQLKDMWDGVHNGSFFTDPAIEFGRGEIESVLKQITLTFSPTHSGGKLGFERLSDGQKSLLYISLVLAWQSIARRVLSGEETGFDIDKLRPPVHTVIALEEPENSLSPHYLGRIAKQLRSASKQGDMQSIVATHAPGFLRRVPPEAIRFLRLDENRTTTVSGITLPDKQDEAAKYVREAVEAFPELYFARLVILGEGDSEQIVLPRVLSAAGITEEDTSALVVPLGGRHVNHFWRLLESLDIPYLTLLDLDAARHGGGWGRIKYVVDQINKFNPGTVKQEYVDKIPKWDSDKPFPELRPKTGAIRKLENLGVFFSHPVDLDLMLLDAYPTAYNVSPSAPTEALFEAVLGPGRKNVEKLNVEVTALFAEYHKQFNLGSKPANHLNAFAALDDQAIMEDLPAPLARLAESVKKKLDALAE